MKQPAPGKLVSSFPEPAVQKTCSAGADPTAMHKYRPVKWRSLLQRNLAFSCILYEVCCTYVSTHYSVISTQNAASAQRLTP